MKSMVDIEVVLDPEYVDPKVTIRTKERTGQVENLIEAIEEVSETDFPPIPGINGDAITLLSQREIVRIYNQDRRVIIQTDKGTYFASRRLPELEGMLNPERFLRISQSEIVNLYKVEHFEFSLAGTIGLVFENGETSWASRSRVKAIKALLK